MKKTTVDKNNQEILLKEKNIKKTTQNLQKIGGIDKQKEDLIYNINNLIPQATYEELRYIYRFVKSLTGVE